MPIDPPNSDLTGAYVPRFDDERFPPGTVLANRYRLVAALGKGGMGEVYRADDLVLGQPVALKFLPLHIARDPDRLARFRREVAAARKVSHPNVCRVYDIAEQEGLSFLSMEFIDGEDLSSVLKRLGRVPEEKGIEIAKQLCSALAAVHEQGLLHRDLKPANVMLDGRGKVHLTDFGLAAEAADLTATEMRSGTPLYMAPEQAAGLQVTVRSDLFSLGLVLYEIFTGKRAFVDKDRTTTPPNPTSHVSSLDPAIVRVILRCLELDPTQRPKSANDVLLGLPGGDPLAAAMAAGETPSPQLVADAGGSGIISVPQGLILLGVIAASIAFLAIASRYFGILQQIRLTESPAAMMARSRELIARFGYQEKPVDFWGEYRPNSDWIDPASRINPYWYRHAGDWPGAMEFWYRQSPSPMYIFGETETHADISIEWKNPPLTEPGMSGLRLDPRGRLLEFYAVPPILRPGSPTDPKSNWWKLAFESAELDGGRLSPIESKLTPPFAYDAQLAWTGTFSDGRGLPIRVEAAAYCSRLVWFRVDPDWTGIDPKSSTPEHFRKEGDTPILAYFLILALSVLSGLLAVRNYRRGKIDRNTAIRLGIVLFGWDMAMWAIISHHPGPIPMEFNGFLKCLGNALFLATSVVFMYAAFEPVVRRRWPWRLTAWKRLFEGRWKDPMIGRDLLVGLTFGAVVRAAEVAINWSADSLGFPAAPLGASNPGFSSDSPAFHLRIFNSALTAPIFSLGFAYFLFLICRREWRTWIAYTVFMSVMQLNFDRYDLSDGLWAVFVLQAFLRIAAFALLLARYGILGGSGWILSYQVLLPTQVPTFDTTLWYFPRGMIVAGILLGLALFFFWTATGCKRPFKEGFFGDE